MAEPLTAEAQDQEKGTDMGPDRPKESPRLQGRTGYGLDEPLTVELLTAGGIVAAVTGVILYFFLVKSNFRISVVSLGIGSVVGGLVLLMALALFWSGRTGKVRAIKNLSRSIPWGGYEGVLDVGCGRGPFSVAAASRLTTGVVISIDLWRKKDVSGNDPRSVVANAKAAGVGGKVNPVRGDARVFPLASGTIDVVISAGSLERLTSQADRGKTVAEIARVLKEGGRVALLIGGRASDFVEILRANGLKDVSVSRVRLGLFPAQTILARKPFEMA